MSAKLDYFSDTKDGRLQPSVTRQILADLPHFNGKRIHITVQRASAKRSALQNNLWWSWMTMLAEHIGDDKNELHDQLKWEFLRVEKVNEKTGELYYKIRGSSELNKLEFGDLTFKMCKWALEFHGVVLPQPGENWELQFTD